MMNTLSSRLAALPKIVTALVVVAVIAALALALWPNNGTRTLTVDFPRANSLYVGSDVKVLGVAIGKVESIEPRGQLVRVRLSYDDRYQVPADVRAVIISPAIVGDRFVQLAPAYSSGPELPDGAHLDVDRAEVPIELDEVYANLSDLAVELGPEGVNADGALSEFVEATAGLLEGQGGKLNSTLGDVGQLSRTLSDNSDELWGSLREVNDFVQLLERNDAKVRAFNASTAQISTVLAEERENLAETLRILGVTLAEAEGFVDDNRSDLRRNIRNLTETSKLFAKHQESLTELTVAGPVAYANLATAYNPYFGTLDTRSDVADLLMSMVGDPVDLICGLVADLPLIGELCEALGGGGGGEESTEGEGPDEGEGSAGSGPPESSGDSFIDEWEKQLGGGE